MKTYTNRKKYIKQEYLPSKLTRRLQESIFYNSNYQYTTKNNFLQCVTIIYYHQVQEGIGLTNFVPLGSDYWKTIYGGNYHERVIEPLLNEHKIIESQVFGSRTMPDKNSNKGKQNGEVSIRYRINPDLLDDQYETIKYIEKGRVLTGLERMWFHDREFIIIGIPDLDFRVSIDHIKASRWVDSNAELICNDFLKTNYIETIPDGLKVLCHELVEYKGNWTYKKKYRSIGVAKIYAETRNKELFYFNDSFYIAETKEFLKQRIQSLRYHYKHQISQIHSQPIEEKRNPNTLRIYSELTNFPSKILQFININNKTVVQLDLRTSQFLIFANLLNAYLSHGERFLLTKFKQEKNQTYIKKLVTILKKYRSQLPKIGVNIEDNTSGQFSLSDVTAYIRDVFFTDFYSVIQHKLGLQERLLAKHVMFHLLFKKSNRPDKLLSRLSQHYPVVMDIIAEFKTKDAEREKKKSTKNRNDDLESNFSVFLQCIEAEIYVDNILNRLHDERIPCFTRHDSIVVASGYEERSEAIAKQVFKDFGFKYIDKKEDKFWEVVDEDELESSDYLQWIIDENELEQDFEIGEIPDDSIENEPENKYNMDEQELEILERLKEIGIRDEYYDYVDAEFLEEIVLLPFLNEKQRNILYDDINNLQDGMSFLQDNTNELLRKLLSRDEGILGIPI